MDSYTVHLNNPEQNTGFATNKVKTTKYSLLTFVPKCTIHQFSRFANLYFLVTALIMLIPILTPVHPLTSIGPLAFVLIISMIKEAIEDLVSH